MLCCFSSRQPVLSSQRGNPPQPDSLKPKLVLLHPAVHNQSKPWYSVLYLSWTVPLDFLFLPHWIESAYYPLDALLLGERSQQTSGFFPPNGSLYDNYEIFDLSGAGHILTSLFGFGLFAQACILVSKQAFMLKAGNISI